MFEDGENTTEHGLVFGAVGGKIRTEERQLVGQALLYSAQLVDSLFEPTDALFERHRVTVGSAWLWSTLFIAGQSFPT